MTADPLRRGGQGGQGGEGSQGSQAGTFAVRRLLAFAAAASMLSTSAVAQEFSRFLKCAGSLQTAGVRAPAHADFALRFNNRTALIQRSNVLPVGQRLAYVPSPATYSMTYRLRPEGTQILALPGWFSQTILIRYPDLRRLNQIRLSIDRQTGGLEAELLNEEEQPLGALEMQCQSLSEEDMPAPKF